MNRYENSWADMSKEEKEQSIDLIVNGLKNKLLSSSGLKIEQNIKSREVRSGLGNGVILAKTVESEKIVFEIDYSY